MYASMAQGMSMVKQHDDEHGGVMRKKKQQASCNGKHKKLHISMEEEVGSLPSGGKVQCLLVLREWRKKKNALDASTSKACGVKMEGEQICSLALPFASK